MGEIAEGVLNIHHPPSEVVNYGEARVPLVSFFPRVSHYTPRLNIRNRATHFIGTLFLFGLILSGLFSLI